MTSDESGKILLDPLLGDGLSVATIDDGRMPERTNGAASKVVVAFGLPGVRIPLLPRRSLHAVRFAH